MIRMFQLKLTIAYIVSAFHILSYYWKLKRRKYKNNLPYIKSNEVSFFARKIKKTGYFVIENYFSEQDCEKLRKEIDRIIQQQPEAVHADAYKAENRVFGSERASSEINKFHKDSFLHKIGEAYYNGKLVNHLTLAGRIENVPDNKGSGQGWHRDSFGFQFKAIIYLSDVTEEHGPFQIIEKSHHLISIITDTNRARLPIPPESRFTDEQVQEVLGGSTQRLKTITGKAGTVILVDTSSIHRGMPILQGSRYALTNYYYAPYQLEENLLKKFRPLALNLDVVN